MLQTVILSAPVFRRQELSRSTVIVYPRTGVHVIGSYVLRVEDSAMV